MDKLCRAREKGIGFKILVVLPHSLHVGGGGGGGHSLWSTYGMM